LAISRDQRSCDSGVPQVSLLRHGIARTLLPRPWITLGKRARAQPPVLSCTLGRLLCRKWPSRPQWDTQPAHSMPGRSGFIGVQEGCYRSWRVNGKCSKHPRNSFSDTVLCASCVPEPNGSIADLFRAIAGCLRRYSRSILP
jgi:hypothetical protein